jgi:hypothetical protein
MVQAFSSQAVHKPFTNSIGLRRSIGCLRFFYAGARDHSRKVQGIFAVSIMDKIFRAIYPRELLRGIVVRSIHPWRIWLWQCVQSSCLEFHHHKDTQWSKQPVINHGKIASPNISDVILHKGGPGLA